MSSQSRAFRPSWSTRPFKPRYRLTSNQTPGVSVTEIIARSQSHSSAAGEQQWSARRKKFPFYTAEDFQPAIANYVPPKAFCFETNDYFQQESTIRQLAEVSALRLWTNPIWIRESSISANSFSLLPFQTGTAIWVPLCGKEFMHIHGMGAKFVRHTLKTYPVPAHFLTDDHLKEATADFSSTLVLDEDASGRFSWSIPMSLLSVFFSDTTRELLRRRLVPEARTLRPSDGKIVAQASHPYTSMFVPQRVAVNMMGYFAATAGVTRYHKVHTPAHVGVFYNGCQFSQCHTLLQLTESVLTGNHPTAKSLQEAAAAAPPEATAASPPIPLPLSADILGAQFDVNSLVPPDEVSGAEIADLDGMAVAAAIEPQPASGLGVCDAALFHDLGATAVLEDSAATVDDVADADFRSAAMEDPTADGELLAEAFPGALEFASAHNAAAEQAAALFSAETASNESAEDELAAALENELDPVAELDLVVDQATFADDEILLEAEEELASVPGALSAQPDASCTADDLLARDSPADEEVNAFEILASTRDAAGVVTNFVIQPGIGERQAFRIKQVAHKIPEMPKRSVAFAPQGAA
jgi:hypothetical protein